MQEKITTIEGLATMIQRTMASKEDLARLESVMGVMREEMNATRVDVNYIRSTMNTLVSNDATQDAAIVNLAERIEILEDNMTLAPA